MHNSSPTFFAPSQLGRSVSIDQAAQLLEVSRRTVYNRIRDGQLLTIRTIGGSQRILRSSLEERAARRPGSRQPAPPPVTVTNRPSHPPPGQAPRQMAATLMTPAVRLALASLLAALLLWVTPVESHAQSRRPRLSQDLANRLHAGTHEPTSIIITGTQSEVDRIASRHGLVVITRLQFGAVLEVPGDALAGLANDPSIDRISSNQIMTAQMSVTNATIGADLVRTGAWTTGVPGLTGQGVGVAVIDSGIAHLPELRGRVVASVDFTTHRGQGLDTHGHGTHVAGIVAAAGANPNDETRGVAPGAHLINLKALDANGRGLMADIIAAVDYAVANKTRFNIRVINLSLGGAVVQPYQDDPLCDAVERAYRAGIVVVASAGNFGRLADGRLVMGGVTTPGVSPFAITVGAINALGTAFRADDVMASYSSKGPTLFNGLLKPDLVAPGNRVRGLLVPGSTLASEHPELVVGTGRDARLELSGTSMAAAAVSGAVAVLVEGGALHPELVRHVRWSDGIGWSNGTGWSE